MSSVGCMCKKLIPLLALTTTAGENDSTEESEALNECKGDTMDSELWSKLPEHLLDIVLAGLPLQSLMRFRSVCKGMKSSLLSPNFLKLCHNRPLEKPWFILSGCAGEYVAHDPIFNKWVKFPPCFLPPSSLVVAASEGLLCVKELQSYKFVVCNPLTASRVELPPMIIQRRNPVMGLVVDKEHHSFKVIVTSSRSDCIMGLRAYMASDNFRDFESHLTTEVYDSVSGSWRVIEVPVDIRMAHLLLQREAVSHEGFIYSAIYGAMHTIVAVYDVNREKWSYMENHMASPMALPRSHTIVMPQICICNGRLLMIAITIETLAITSVAIWKLSWHGNGWRRKDVLPAPMLEELMCTIRQAQICLPSVQERFKLDDFPHVVQCVGQGDLVCLVFASRRVLMYCISHRSWYWLPCCPLVEKFGPKAFAFQPMLEASVN